MKIGAIEIQPVIDGRLVSHLWSTKPHPRFPHDGRLESTLGGFLVRTGDRIVLVDAGAGQAFLDGHRAPVTDVDDPGDPIAAVFRSRGVADDAIRGIAALFANVELDQGHLPESLAALGVHPHDVTDLVITHLHFDHIGWATADGAPYFPKATIPCAAADLDYFLGRADAEATTSLVSPPPPPPHRPPPTLPP